MTRTTTQTRSGTSRGHAGGASTGDAGDATDTAFRVETTAHATVRYSPTADALAIRYAEGAFCFTAEIGEGRYLDYSTDGRVLGVEILDAQHGVELEGVPFADEVRAALDRLDLPISAPTD